MEDKASRYCVVGEHAYRAPDGDPARLVYATRVGKVLPVRSAVAESLARGEVPVCSAAELQRLRDFELLVAVDEDELAVVTERFAHHGRARQDRHVVLFPTSYCNMGCTYCGQTHVKGALRGRHRESVRRRVLGVIDHPETESLRLDWFGGEPLMGYAVIRDLASDFVPAAQRAGIGWASTMVTNGSLLDPRKVRVLANECRVTHAEITIDGLFDQHDRHRPLKSGGRSFERIIDTITASLTDESTRSLTFGLRTNVDVTNAEWVPDLLRFYAAQGFAHPRIRIGLKSIHSWSNDVSHSVVAADTFATRELEWMELMQELGLRFEALPTAAKRVVCPAATQADEFVTSEGQVFSCSEQPLVVSQADAAVGSLKQTWAVEDLLRPAGRYDDWVEEVGHGGRACSSCEFYPVCGGACPKLWREGEVPCPSFKRNGRQRLDIVARMNGLSALPEATPVSR